VRAAPPIPAHVAQAVRRALRESTYSLEDAREAAQPRSFAQQPAAQEAVAGAVGGPGATVGPLPFFQEDQRVLRRERAVSVRVSALETWLRSEQGW
jgi:hypothetical protein